MRKTFKINTEPHVAEIGDAVLNFLPEVMGDEFVQHYAELRDAQAATGLDLDDLINADPSKLRDVVASLRVFLARLMLPESAAVFARWDVVSGGNVVGSYQDPAEAQEAAAEQPRSKVVDASMRLPDRVLVELLEWAVELYGGGATARPTGSSNVSAPPSPSRGTRGKAALPSRA